jgi:hypothetical protein
MGKIIEKSGNLFINKNYKNNYKSKINHLIKKLVLN